MSQRYIGGLIYNPPGGFSGYFDGSGDWLTATKNAAYEIGSGDFTVEAWIFPTAGGALYNSGILSYGASSSLNGWLFGITGSNVGGTLNRVMFEYNYDGTLYLSTSPVALNAWNHVAVSRSGSNIYVFLNGVLQSTTSTTKTANTNAGDVSVIGSESYSPSDSNRIYTGYISNLRLVKGTAVYTASFNPPTGQLQAITNTSLLTCAYPTFRDGSSNNFTITVNGNTAVSTQNPFPLTQLPNPALGNQGNGVYTMSQYQALRSQNLWPAIDPYWEYVTLMLHGNGTNGAQNNTFLDSSTNNFTITRNGNTTQGAFSPYGDNWSNYFDGSGDWLDVASNAALGYGTGDFTIEFWMFPTSASGLQVVVDQRTGSATRAAPTLYTSSGGITYYVSGNNRINGGTVPTNQWSHIALARSGTSTKLFLNGVQTGATYTDTTNYLDSPVRIGDGNDGVSAYPFPGYISNLRILKGTALYTAAFTPPTAPLTAITNTSLLTCQSNRFIDNSTNNFTITRNGDVSVQRFSPFHPTAPYAAGTIGGSGYFDGTGDYLTAPNNTALDLSTGDFTVEVWFYPTQANQSGAIVNRHNGNYATGNDFQYGIYMSSGSLIVRPYQGTTDYTTNVGTPQRNAWNHAALVRTGNTFYGFLNGVRGTTSQTISGALNNSTWATYLGAALSASIGNDFFTGYMGAVRITKGGALYTGSTYTVPTAPLTTTVSSGTVSLLTDFTNGGIIDNAMMNDLETVGNAQISTSVSKFGGGSLAFDGSGDILSSPGSQNYVFNGDFTVEGWVYIDSTMASSRPDNLKTFIFVGWNTGNTPQLYVYGTTSTAGIGLGYYDGTTAWEVAATVPKDQWAHIAYARIGSALYGFVNGVRYTINASISATIGSANTFVVGGNPNQVSAYYSYLKGNIDDLRITKGYARYTANFTPQRSQWQDQ